MSLVGKINLLYCLINHQKEKNSFIGWHRNHVIRVTMKGIHVQWGLFDHQNFLWNGCFIPLIIHIDATCRDSSSSTVDCNTSPNQSTTGYNISGGIRSATRPTQAATATKAFYCFTHRNTGLIPRKRNTIYVVVNVYYHDQKEPYVVSLCRLKKLKIKFILLVVQHTAVHKYVSIHAATKNYIYKPLCNF